MAARARSLALAGDIGRLCRALAVALLLAAACPAAAAVRISFHSKDFGATFPHAFIVLEGTLDSTGEPVAGNYGFTVRHLIGPSVLFGPVKGEVISEGAAYVAGSNYHFAMTLSDDRYRAVMEVVERWRSLPQPSYLLDRRNCVSFVAEVAAVLGLAADPRGSMRRPRAFLDRVRRDNLSAIAVAGGQTPKTGR
jgi:hypothetical protein